MFEVQPEPVSVNKCGESVKWYYLTLDGCLKIEDCKCANVTEQDKQARTLS